MKRNIGMPQRVVTVLLLLFCSMASWSYTVNTEELRLVIVWNDITSSMEAPIGWQVGTTTRGEDSPAPEVGKSVLKHLIVSLDTLQQIPFWSTLDTTSIPDQLTTNSGFDVNGTMRFKNLRIYRASNAPSFSEVVTSFGGNNPNAIIYVNAGVSDDTNTILYKLLQDANAANVGLVTIGDNAAVEAKNIDPTKTIFPVMGVQKNFRVRQAPGDLLKEFNFIAANDTVTINGRVWTVPDTVVLSMSGTEGRIYLKNEGKNELILTIQEGGVGVALAPYASDPVLTAVAAAIQYQYGTFSIDAQVVEVIDRDDYTPDMNAGISYNYDVWYGADAGKIRVANVTWTREVRANNQLIAGRGAFLNIPSGDLLVNGDGSVTLLKDYLVEVPNEGGWGTGIDTIRILKQGLTVMPFTNEANGEGGTWLGSDDISATGGLRQLRIALDKAGNNAGIFSAIFPSLNGISELSFKPWTRNGRLQADADMWAVYNGVDTAHFADISVNGFDPAKYYYCYLGDQIAGVEGNGNKQFVKAPKTYSQYDDDIHTLEFDALPGGVDYVTKLYHAVSAIRHGSKRIVMLGFQPNYLDDKPRSLGMVYDAVVWASYDAYKFPTPTFNPAAGSDVYTDQNSVQVDVDFPGQAIEISQENYKLYYTATYGSTTISDSTLNLAGDRTITWDISALGVSPNNKSNTQIVLKAWVVPTSIASGFSSGDTGNATYTIKTIYGGAYDVSGFEFGKTTSDTLVFTGARDVVLKGMFGGSEVSGSQVYYTMSGGTTGSATIGTGATIQVTGPGVTTLRVVGKKGNPQGYIESDTVTYLFKRGAEQLTNIVVTPNTSTVANTSGYLFAEDTSLALSLSNTTSVGGVPITTADYNVRYVFGIMGDTTNAAVIGGTLDSCVPVSISMNFIEAVIAAGDTAITFSAIAVDQPGSTIEWATSSITTEQYNFRRVDVRFTQVDSVGSGLHYIISAYDPISNTELQDASISVTNASMAALSSGDTLLIPHGTSYSFQATRTAYIPSAVEVQDAPALPVDLKLYAVWMPNAGATTSYAQIAQPETGFPCPIDPYSNVETASLLMLSATANYFAQSDYAQIKVVSVRILDPVGNVIVSATDFDYTTAGFRVVPARTDVKIGNDVLVDQFVIAIAWDARNKYGKPVAPGAYNVIIDTKWPGSKKVLTTNALVSVRFREGLKTLD